MIPAIEWCLTKAKEAPSPRELRLTPLDTNPVSQCLGEKSEIWSDKFKIWFLSYDKFTH